MVTFCLSRSRPVEGGHTEAQRAHEEQLPIRYQSGGQHRPAASGPCCLPDKDRQGGGLEANRDRLQLDAQQIACCLALWKGVVWLAQAHFGGGQCGVISLAAATPASSTGSPLQPSFPPPGPSSTEHSTAPSSRLAAQDPRPKTQAKTRVCGRPVPFLTDSPAQLVSCLLPFPNPSSPLRFLPTTRADHGSYI